MSFLLLPHALLLPYSLLLLLLRLLFPLFLLLLLSPAINSALSPSPGSSLLNLLVACPPYPINPSITWIRVITDVFNLQLGSRLREIEERTQQNFLRSCDLGLTKNSLVSSTVLSRSGCFLCHSLCSTRYVLLITALRPLSLPLSKLTLFLSPSHLLLKFESIHISLNNSQLFFLQPSVGPSSLIIIP
jgi:hypothetical protein